MAFVVLHASLLRHGSSSGTSVDKPYERNRSVKHVIQVSFFNWTKSYNIVIKEKLILQKTLTLYIYVCSSVFNIFWKRESKRFVITKWRGGLLSTLYIRFGHKTCQFNPLFTYSANIHLPQPQLHCCRKTYLHIRMSVKRSNKQHFLLYKNLCQYKADQGQ